MSTVPSGALRWRARRDTNEAHSAACFFVNAPTMKLSACVACELPVLELEGQFELLDSLFVSGGEPPELSAGEWHLSCLRTSAVGPSWQDARVRNFRDTRGFVPIAERNGWQVLRDPRRGKVLAFGTTGEMLNLSLGGRKNARTAPDGLVFPISNPDFHLELDDRELVRELQETLVSKGAAPLELVLEKLHIADRMVDRIALERAAFRFDEDLQGFWGPRRVSARVEYGVFVPDVLQDLVGERVR